MLDRVKLKIDQEEQQINKISGIPEPEEIEEKSHHIPDTVFISNSDITIVFSETRKRDRRINDDGTESIIIIPAKRLSFKNRVGSTNDPEIINAAIQHKEFGNSYFYHPKYVPANCTHFIKQAEGHFLKNTGKTKIEKKDKPEIEKIAYEMAVEVAKGFANVAKTYFGEIKEGIERAKDFDRGAHPEEGMKVIRDGKTEIREW